MDWKLELVAVPVTDVDRAKRFYSEQVGFVADFVEGPGGDWNSFVFFNDPDGNGWAVQETPCGT
jgi:predicted enzyme related to lactoylglutathione lyase